MLRQLNQNGQTAVLIIGLSLAFGGQVALQSTSANAGTVKPSSSGVAVGGYDVVAYFNTGKPVKGSTTFKSTHDGVDYHFANAAQKAVFDGDPKKYVPAYGGHCALGMRYGQKSPVDPTAWRIRDEKLYLMLSPGTAVMWENKAQNNITVADKVWSKYQ